MKITFKNWMLQFINSPLLDGDLAKDIQEDSYFPLSTYYGEHYDYLQSRGASREVLEVFKQAWEVYDK